VLARPPGAFVAERRLDVADVAEGGEGGAPCLVGTHPLLDELLGAHLEVELKLVRDVATRIGASVG
jgi:hypothetical protein